PGLRRRLPRGPGARRRRVHRAPQDRRGPAPRARAPRHGGGQAPARLRGRRPAARAPAWRRARRDARVPHRRGGAPDRGARDRVVPGLRRQRDPPAPGAGRRRPAARARGGARRHRAATDESAAVRSSVGGGADVRRRYREDPMTETSARTARPAGVDLDAWQAARDELLVREKAHTRAGDALAAERRRLPMVEVDGTTEVVGADGPVPFVDLFQGRDELLVYQHMWHDGEPHGRQCPGCTLNAWHVQQSAPYLAVRGVSLAILTEGPWDEVDPYVDFMGYTEPWYSVRG